MNILSGSRLVILVIAIALIFVVVAYFIVISIFDVADKPTLTISLLAIGVSITGLLVNYVIWRQQFEASNVPFIDAQLKIERYVDTLSYCFKVTSSSFHRQIDAKNVKVFVSIEKKGQSLRWSHTRWLHFVDGVSLSVIKADSKLTEDLPNMRDLDDFVASNWPDFVKEVTGPESSITRPILVEWSPVRVRFTVQYEPAIVGKSNPRSITRYYTLEAKLWRDDKTDEELTLIIDKDGERFPLTSAWELKES